MFERATENRSRPRERRRIKLPGKAEAYANTDPLEIARELRTKSKLGKREARLAAAEEKLRD
jgi:hypothetical protein